MATPNRIHPVRFNLETQCGVRDARFEQIVQVGDPTQFQMLLDVCAAEKNMVINGGFNNPSPSPWVQNGGAWTYSWTQGEYTHQGTGTSGSIYQLFDVNNGVLMRVEFTMRINGGGSASVIAGAGTWLEGFTESGTYVRYINAFNWSSFALWVLAGDDVTFSNVSAYPINTNFTVRIIDIDDNEVFSFNAVDDPAYFVFAQDSMTVTYNWKGLPDGCYRIEVADPCDCGQGGFVAMDFVTVQNQWLYNYGSWVIENGVAAFDSLSAGLKTVSIENFGCRYVTYRVTYEIVGISAGVSVGAYIGNNFTGAPAHTTDGVKVDIITTSAFSTGYAFQFRATATGVGQTFSIINLKVEAVDLDYGFTSVPFQLYQNAPCSVCISGCCNNDVLGTRFIGTGFRPFIRLRAMYGQGHYLSKEEMEERSTGFKGIYYFRNREIRLLKYAAPKYVHDFMANIRAYDHCWIDDDSVQYEGDGYPKPEYVDDFNFADVTLEVSDKTQLIEKRTPNNNVKSCSKDGQGVRLIADGQSGWAGGFLITTERKEKLVTG